MEYRVVITKKARSDLDRIDNLYRSRIIAGLAILARDPHQGKKLAGKHKGDWSYRVWPYRIIYRIKKKEPCVLIVRVGHRQGVY